MVNTGLDECSTSMVLVSKVFLARKSQVRVPGKRVPLRKNGGIEKGKKGVPLEGECTNVVEGTHP